MRYSRYGYQAPRSRRDEIMNEQWEPGHEEDERKGQFTGYVNGRPTFNKEDQNA